MALFSPDGIKFQRTMENFSSLEKDLSDDEEKKGLQVIALEKRLISQSQSLMGGTLCEDSLPQGVQNISTRLDIAVAAAEDTTIHYYNALAANLEYDSYLAMLETNLKKLIADCNTNLDKLDRDRNDHIGRKPCQLALGSRCLIRFGAPFFKDRNYFPCPPNADTVSKMQQDELCWIDVPTIRWWKPGQTKKLLEAIKKLSEEACRRDALIEKGALKQECNALEENSEERKRIEEVLQNFCAADYVSKHLQEKIATADHDWMQLSVSVLDGKQSAHECRAFWYAYLHPKFSKAKWTEEEDLKLRSLAKDNNHQDWDFIAEQLGGRSGYQCFAQYKNRTEQSWGKCKWTKLEDKHLSAIVEKLRMGDFIPWDKVAMEMKDRSMKQVYNRWNFSLDPTIKKGGFTVQEDIIILRAVQKWGKKFSLISSYMPGRKVPQIRGRYSRTLSKLNMPLPWTTEEDDLLLRWASKRPGRRKQWSKISQRFPGKSSKDLQHRYDILAHMQRTSPERGVVNACEKAAPNISIFTSHPEMWANAEKLLSVDYPKSFTVSTPASTRQPKPAALDTMPPKPASPKSVSQRKTSLIDEQLQEYFEGTCFEPPNPKFTSLPECDPVLIRDVAAFLELLGAHLDIPSADLDTDESLEPQDRQILKGLHAAHPKVLASETLRLETEVNDTDTRTSASNLEANMDNILQGDSSTLVPNLPCPSSFEVPEPDTVKLEHPVYGHLKYLCPPNWSTLIGLRSVLLNKHKLVDSVTDVATDPLLHDVGDEKSDAYRRATQLWEDRLLFLFALPTMLINSERQDSLGNNPGASGLPPPRSAPWDDSGPGTADALNVGRTMILGDGSVINTGKKKNDGKARNPRPKKRARKS